MAVENGYTYTLSGSNATITDFDPTTSSHGYDPVIPTSFNSGSYPVVAVADNALKNKSLTSVQIDHAIDVGDNSFSDNSTLTVTLNANITTNAVLSTVNPPFESCSIGANLTIGGSVTTIPKYLFCNSGLTSLTLASNITTIADYAFCNNSLSTLTFDYSVDVGDNSFSDNGALIINMNANITTSQCSSYLSSPFENCTVGSNLTIGGSVTTIPKYLFAYAGITSVTIPSGVTVIDDYAFRNNSITSLTLDYALDLGDEAFAENSGLTLTINANITTSRVGSYVSAPFENCTVGANLTIGGSVTTIPKYLFAYAGLTSVAIPSGVTVIDDYAFRNNSITSLTLDYALDLGDEAFAENSGLTLTINANVTTSRVGSYVSAPFENCTVGTNLTIGGSVTTIPNNLFAYAGLTEIELSSNIVSVGSNALRNNANLASVTVNNTTTTFGTNVLTDNMSPASPGTIYGHTGSTAETLANSISNYVFVSLQSFAFLGCGQYVKIYLNSDLEFTGVINDTTYKKVDGVSAPIFQDVHCVGLNNVPARRTIKLDYAEGTTASVIVNDMIDQYLNQEGIEAGRIDDGIQIADEWKNDLINITDVLDECASRSSFQWFIDKDMKLQFYQDGTVTFCTHTIEESGDFQDYRDVRINETIDNYTNKPFVVGGNDDHGDVIYTINGDLTKQNGMQRICGGTGVYGIVHRNSSIVEHDYKVIESGSSPTQVNYTSHPMRVGDFFWNVTRDAYSFVESVDTNSFTCESITSQGSGDTIEVYVECNNIGKNILKRQSTIPQILHFKTHTLDFEAGQALTVSLSNMSVSGVYCIDEVQISEIEGTYFESIVKAIKRVSISEFSSQKNPNYADYFRGF